MTIALLPALILLPIQGPKMTTLTLKDVGMSLQHPKTWKETKTKDGIEFTIPIPNSSSTAKLTIYSMNYTTDQAGWETSQQEAAKQLDRTLVKQWQEQLLDVPLLLAKTSYDDKGTATTALNGLLYSLTPRKMVFRLVAASDSYDTAEFEFRNALQTLHTINGALPAEQDPHKKPQDLSKREPPSGKPIVIEEPVKKFVPTLGPVVVVGKDDWKAAQIRLPKGWSATPTATGFDVKSAEVPEGLSVNVVGSGAPDSPEVALIKSSGKSLDMFKTVAQRSEVEPTQCAGGAMVSRIWRRGIGANGPAASCDAAGQAGSYYWIVTFRRDGKAVTPAEQKAIDEMLSTLRIDPAK